MEKAIINVDWGKKTVLGQFIRSNISNKVVYINIYMIQLEFGRHFVMLNKSSLHMVVWLKQISFLGDANCYIFLQLRDWLDLSLNHSVPSSLLILSRYLSIFSVEFFKDFLEKCDHLILSVEHFLFQERSDQRKLFKLHSLLCQMRLQILWG